MKLVDRYIILHTMRVMLATFAIGVLVLTLARLTIILRLKAIDDQDFGVIFRMLGYFMPNYFGFMLPFALFWACFTVTRELSSNSEIRAFTAAGISQKRLVLPFLLLGSLITGLNFLVYGWLEPVARYNYRSMVHQIENTASYMLIQPGTFMKAGNRTVLVDEINREEKTFRNLMIYERDEQGYSREIFAATGQLLVDGNKSVLRLQNGARLRLKPVNLASASVEKIEENMRFDTMDLPLADESNSFHQRGKDEEELTLRELMTSQQTPPPESSPARVWLQLNHKLVVIFTALILPFFAVAMGQAGPRGTHYLRAAIAFVIVILYQQLVDFGRVFAREHDIQGAAVLWPVFGTMAVISIAAFLSLDASRDNLVLQGIAAVMRPFQNMISLAINRMTPEALRQ